jgi:hypothetical protein
MEIRNATQFSNFIESRNMTSLHPHFSQLSQCLMKYRQNCGLCTADKNKSMYSVCNSLYIQIVNNIVPNFKAHFFVSNPDTSVAFYDDKNIIKTVTR